MPYPVNGQTYHLITGEERLGGRLFGLRTLRGRGSWRDGAGSYGMDGQLLCLPVDLRCLLP